MSDKIQAVKGMNDILPTETCYWAHLEDVVRHIANSYGYNEIRFPVLEHTRLFKRTIGEVTDIIEKEMYTFEDRNGESLSMRPEGTAGCVRAGIEHGLFYNQLQRLWYLGPMFRYERPQQGRFRQFYQFGIEAFGMGDAAIDAEQILIARRIWDALGIKDQVNLQLNTLGTGAAREKYREKLIEFFTENLDVLDEDSKRRLTTNPLRILDSKNPNMQLILSAAPRITDFLDDISKKHFYQLLNYLDKANVSYQINPRVVRGLDYYNMTVYEWTTDLLGAQGTVCAGGRYDGLVEHLGGKSTPAVGFAMGLERIATLLEAVFTPEPTTNVYFIVNGENTFERAMSISEKLHSLFPELLITNDFSTGSFKSQFKRADKSGAKIALILGENEVNSGTIALKYLREDRPQCTLQIDELDQVLLKALTE